MNGIYNLMADKGGQYFEDKKKGEMNEVRNQLNGVINDNDTKKGQEVIRKIIGYLTLGMDASPVFSQMCRASFIDDAVMKKMIYFYLTTYAEDNPDLAIMAVNTFKKDCHHSSPNIRGLALRNLCSFKSSDYVNNVLPVIRELLNDFEPYVKKTAIMGVLKVFYVEPMTIIEDNGLIDSLSNLIRDSDSTVSANALLALDQILTSEGGIALNSRIYFYLLKRLREYSEWHQASIVEVLYRYTPQNDKEHYDTMMVLWEKLKHSSTALVLGCIRIIVKLAREKSELFKSVVDKTKAPLLTLLSSNESAGNFETAFVVLQHIEYIIENMNGKVYYETDFKYFYCRSDEPTYIKGLKVRIMSLLANEFNLGDLLNELNDYAADINQDMARRAVRALTSIAVRLPEVSKPLLVNLQSFFKSTQPHLVNESVLSYYKILRKEPKLFADVQATLLDSKDLITQTESIKAFLWILGTFSHLIAASPYILEDFLEEDVFHNLETSSKEILLTQIVQTFLKRPGETLKILSKIFKSIFQGERVAQTLIDHAAFYYRALKNSPEEVKKGFTAIEADMNKITEIKGDLGLEEDFNTLGIIFKQKESKFLKNYEYFVTMRSKELGLIDETAPIEAEQEEDQLAQSVDTYQVLEAKDFVLDVAMNEEEFEAAWTRLTQSASMELQICNEQHLDEEGVEELFKMWGIMSMAAAEEGNGSLLQFYMYAKLQKGPIIGLEIQINKAEHKLGLITKAINEGLASLVNDYVKEFLELNELLVA